MLEWDKDGRIWWPQNSSTAFSSGYNDDRMHYLAGIADCLGSMQASPKVRFSDQPSSCIILIMCRKVHSNIIYADAKMVYWCTSQNLECLEPGRWPLPPPSFNKMKGLHSMTPKTKLATFNPHRATHEFSVCHNEWIFSLALNVYLDKLTSDLKGNRYSNHS